MNSQHPLFLIMKKYFYIAILSLIVSCSDDADKEKDSLVYTLFVDTPDSFTDNFDRSQFLTNLYDNNIIPAFLSFQNQLNDLHVNISALTKNPNNTNLNNARTSWVNAYMTWQSVEMFNLRKAEEVSLAALMNSYPCIESAINNKITQGVSEIGAFNISLLGTTGFPAVGYLLYGNDSTSIIESLQNNNYNNYLLALIENMSLKTSLVVDDWQVSRSDFVNSTGNSQTSSFNVVTNDFLQYYEKRVREAKVATPIDYRGSQQPRPDQVESYYHSIICKALLDNAFQSVKRFYTGESFQQNLDGVGLEDYLESLNGTSDLVTEINNAITDVEYKISALNDDFILQLNNDPEKLIDVFLSMQALVTLFKADMFSFLGVSPDYADNDGDGG